MEKPTAQDSSQGSSSLHRGSKSLPNESRSEIPALGNLKIVRQNVKKKKEEKPKKQLDGKANGLWDAAKTRTNLQKNKKSTLIYVSQSATQRFEGFYKNYVPITDIKSEADWRIKYET
jgi:hypothetical protein